MHTGNVRGGGEMGLKPDLFLGKTIIPLPPLKKGGGEGVNTEYIFM